MIGNYHYIKSVLGHEEFFRVLLLKKKSNKLVMERTPHVFLVFLLCSHFLLHQKQILGMNTFPFTRSGHRVERGLPLRLVQLGSSLDGRPAAPRGGALPQSAGQAPS